MNPEIKIKTLRSEINKSLLVLVRLEDFIIDFQQEISVEKSGKKLRIQEAMIITQAFTNYYTCIETLFLRISKFFENNLDKKQWHRSLLEKMTLEIETIRPRVISESVYKALLEFLKFRHFSRYYFELDYDWDKLEFLQKKFNDIHISLKNEIAEFDSFLKSLL